MRQRWPRFVRHNSARIRNHSGYALLMMRRFTGILLAVVAAMGCRMKTEMPAAPATVSEKSLEPTILKWRADRLARLTSDDGWLTLVGLHWLAEGKNMFGSAKTNRVVLTAKAPEVCGTLVLGGGEVTLQPIAGSGMTIGGQPVTTSVKLVPDTDPKGPTVVDLGSLRFHVIERAGKYALRVKDRDSEARKEFKGLDYFPIDPKWRVEARFQPFNPPRHVAIANVLGMTTDEISPGILSFTIEGKTYSLQPILEQGQTDYFLIFKDETSGKETYPAARYVYAPPPGADGRTVIDFNKAYNPPCAFTPFATCPLPPPQNRLPIRVEAGEKKYAGGH